MSQVIYTLERIPALQGLSLVANGGYVRTSSNSAWELVALARTGSSNTFIGNQTISAGNLVVGGTVSATGIISYSVTAGAGSKLGAFQSSAAERIQFFDENSSSSLGPKINFNAGNIAQFAGAGSLAMIFSSVGVNNSTTSPTDTLTVNGGGRFFGSYNESTTNAGLYTGVVGTPRVMFANGTAAQNWQIDNASGDFRWFLPGVTHMTLNTTGLTLQNKLTAPGATITSLFSANGSSVGFFGSSGTSKPTVSGSRGSNAALASLLTALANMGLLIDSSS